jgi:ABC-type phosphate transport system substrate-binding protein
MASFSARRFRSACAVPAIALAALALPGVASAKKIEQCGGVQTFTGAGSTLQKTAQEGVWGPDFINTSNINPLSCNGTNGSKGRPVGPKVTAPANYESIGSGPGMEKWGLEEPIHKTKAFSTATDFVATDEAPNAAQKAQIEGEGSPVETIPVLQASVASLVHLPEGCTATSTDDPGRLDLGNETLNELWNGTIQTWGELVATPESIAAGDEIKGSAPPSKAECEADVILRYARAEESGTSHIFKSYLGLIAPTAKYITSLPTSPNDWDELKEEAGNTVWPTAASVKTVAAGGGALVEDVLNNPSSVGYAALTDARAKKGAQATPLTFYPTTMTTEGGAGTATFWTPLENKKATLHEPATYADPSIDDETSVTATQSNCEFEEYTNGTTVFPPKKTSDPWNNVTTRTTEPKYTLCGLTFDLAYTKYKNTPFGKPLGEEVEQTVGDYYRWELATGTGGGQTEINNGHDYEALTPKLIEIADKGLKKIKG